MPVPTPRPIFTARNVEKSPLQALKPHLSALAHRHNHYHTHPFFHALCRTHGSSGLPISSFYHTGLLVC